MATIRKRGQYQWQAMVRKKGFPHQSQTFETKAEAIRWADHIEEAMRNESFKGILKAEHTTFEEIINQYLEDFTPLKKGNHREQSFIRTIKKNFKALNILDKPIGRITAEDITDYIDLREDEVASGTVLREVAIISHVFTKARKKYRLHVGNPVQDVDKPKAGDPRKRRCSRREQKILMEAASKYGKDEMMEIIIPFAIETAMRRGEIVRLVWENINLDEGTAYLPETKNHEERTVPLSPYAIQLLRQSGVKESGRAFPLEADSVTQAFIRIRTKTDIENIRFHDLRHEATSRLFEKGLNATEVKLITGHKSYQMLDRYTHLNAKNLVEKLAKADEPKLKVKLQRGHLSLVA